MKKFFFLLFFISSFYSFSQNLSAYNDYRNYFQAFDNGEFRQIDYLPVKSFQVGGAAIAYVDNSNEFRIYSDEQKFDITYGGTLLYPAYASAPRIAGLTPLDDQLLGGLIMWIPGGLVLFGVISVIFFRWQSHGAEDSAASAQVDWRPAGGT